jgi:hypothetical protein
MRHYVLRPVLAILAAGMLSMPALAQLQPGSTGGTIGKTGKSSSGGEEQIEPSSRPRREAPTRETGTTEKSTGSPCQKFVGAWGWMAGTETVFSQNGSGRNNAGFTSTWTCANGVASVKWNHGVVDRVTISRDGSSLSISSSAGNSFTANRK